MLDLSSEIVMVAGGGGFVGSAVVRELLDRDISVISYDNYLHGIPDNVADLEGPLSVVRGDILDEWNLIDTLQRYKVSVIIDCVGDTFVPTAYEMPKRFFDINVMGTLNILRAAELLGIKRLVYISSTEVYGTQNARLLNEGTCLNPVNTYAVSKLAADRLCYTYAVEHNVNVVIARIFNCYGPRESEPYIIPEIISQLSKSNVLRIGNRKAARDFTFVHDTARALIAVLESGLASGTVVNVGSNTSYTVEWLAHTIAELMGVTDLEIQCDPDRLRVLDIDHFRCDNTLLKQATEWSPKVSIREGLAMTIEWFRTNGCRWSWESFVDGTRIYR